MALAAVLSLHSAGRVTGVVVDSGESATNVVPVYEGFAMSHAILRMNLGGVDVTTHLGRLLDKDTFPRTFTNTVEQRILRDVKEKLAYVAIDVDQEMREGCDVEKDYELPDGNIMTIGNQRFRSAEVLFN